MSNVILKIEFPTTRHIPYPGTACWCGRQSPWTAPASWWPPAVHGTPHQWGPASQRSNHLSLRCSGTFQHCARSVDIRPAKEGRKLLFYGAFQLNLRIAFKTNKINIKQGYIKILTDIAVHRTESTAECLNRYHRDWQTSCDTNLAAWELRVAVTVSIILAAMWFNTWSSCEWIICVEKHLESVEDVIIYVILNVINYI